MPNESCGCSIPDYTRPTIVVIPTNNTAPIAEDDIIETMGGYVYDPATEKRYWRWFPEPVTIDVLSNDVDIEGDIEPTKVKILYEGLEYIRLTRGGVRWQAEVTGEITITTTSSEVPPPMEYVVYDEGGNRSVASLIIEPIPS